MFSVRLEMRKILNLDLRMLHRSFSNNTKTTCTAEDTGDSSRFGVYIHWPYCARKCTYCNFNKYVVDQVDQESLVENLLIEWETMKLKNNLSNPTTIFFGGGTPSLMKPKLIEKILRRLVGSNTKEISLEANPSDILDKSLDFKCAGISRLSLGVQSFNDRILELFNRDHNASTAKKSLQQCLNHFGDHVSADLIFGAPGQSLDEWLQDLDFVGREGVNHVSAYQLTVEKGTRLEKQVKKRIYTLPDSETMADMYQNGIHTLHTHGIYRYEVSNFAREGLECDHNIGYWSGKQYVGLGPGSHSRLGVGCRRRACINHPSPKRWSQQVKSIGHGVAKDKILDREHLLAELIATGLRRREGISASDWDTLSDGALSFHQFIQYLTSYNNGTSLSTHPLPSSTQITGSGEFKGVVWSESWIRLTPKYLNVADLVILNVYSFFLTLLNKI